MWPVLGSRRNVLKNALVRKCRASALARASVRDASGRRCRPTEHDKLGASISCAQTGPTKNQTPEHRNTVRRVPYRNKPQPSPLPPPPPPHPPTITHTSPHPPRPPPPSPSPSHPTPSSLPPPQPAPHSQGGPLRPMIGFLKNSNVSSDLKLEF